MSIILVKKEGSIKKTLSDKVESFLMTFFSEIKQEKKLFRTFAQKHFCMKTLRKTLKNLKDLKQMKMRLRQVKKIF